MASVEQLDQARKSIASINEVPAAALVTNPKWGEISFETAQPNLELVQNLAATLGTLPLEIVPQSTFGNFVAALVATESTVKQIKAFTLSSNPQQRRDELVGQLATNAEQLLVAVQGWIGFLAYQKGDIQRNLGELSEAVRAAAEILGDARVGIKAKQDEIADIIRAAREASAGAGVATFTRDFATQADALETTARSWLIATGVLVVATIAAAVLWPLAFPVGADAAIAQLAQYFTSKVVVLGLLLTASIWCGRLYRASKHQAATCAHRANALLTFQAFVKASDNETTRDAVLLETTRSIFAIAPSGYLEAVESSPDVGSKVLEVFKSGGKSG